MQQLQKYWKGNMIMKKNKRIAYDYLFNYFGGDKQDGKLINGAVITLNIRAYKDGKEVLFEEGKEPKTHGKYLSNIFDVCFDRENQFTIKRNLQTDNLFRLVFGWERIEASVIAYHLDVVVGRIGDEKENGLPEEFQNLPIAEPMAVTEEIYRKFLADHVGDFDISDNKQAQVPSVTFYDLSDEEVDR